MNSPLTGIHARPQARMMNDRMGGPLVFVYGFVAAKAKPQAGSTAVLFGDDAVVLAQLLLVTAHEGLLGVRVHFLALLRRKEDRPVVHDILGVEFAILALAAEAAA